MSTLTTILAVWGAILSSFLALWNIYKDIRDKGFLRVEGYLSEWDEIDDDNADEENNNKLITKYEIEIIITNIGRRSIVIHSLGYGREEGWQQYIWRRLPVSLRMRRSMPDGLYEAIFDVNKILPKKLEPGDFVIIKRDKLFFLKEENITMFALDSFGRYFFISAAALERMKRNYDPQNTQKTVEHLFAKIRQP